MKVVNKILIVLIVICALGYMVDAIYPQWSFECKGKSVGGLWVYPSSIPELMKNPAARVVVPTRPNGCTLTANNMLRRLYDWLAADNESPTSKI